MKREEKQIIINSLTEKLQQYPHFYLADTAGLNAENTAKLRKLCFDREIKLMVVKNTFFKIALESAGKDGIEELFGSLKGTTAVMFTNTGNAPAKLIKEFSEGPASIALKAAFVEECAYVGASQLDTLVAIKSREELIGDIVALLQSPVKNVVSALQSSGHKLSGIVKTLSERE